MTERSTTGTPKGAPAQDDTSLDRLLDLFAVIDARISDDSVSKGELVELRSEITRLHREIDAAITARQELREKVRGLISRWKMIEAKVSTVPGSSTSARVDHLGASTYIERGWSLLSAGDAHAAEEPLRTALSLAPLNIEAGTLLAWTFVSLGRLDAADLLLARISGIDPGYSLARVVRGFHDVESGDTERAVNLLMDVATSKMADRRSRLYAYLYCGIALRLRGEFDEARQTFEHALQIGPNFLEAAFELGRTLELESKTDAAISVWRRAAAANSFSPWGKKCSDAAAGHGHGAEALSSS